MVAAQFIFVVNFFYSMFFGPKAGRNPWHANGLEWTAPSPPGHGNFDFQPVVYRGPYEYGSPETTEDYYPQIMPPPEDRPPAAKDRMGINAIDRRASDARVACPRLGVGMEALMSRPACPLRAVGMNPTVRLNAMKS